MNWRRNRTHVAEPAGQTERGEVEDPAARAHLKRLEARAYKTYRARESARGRLARRARAWNWALVAFSTSTTIASIGMLTDDQMYGPNGDTLLVCLSILVLVTSLTTSNMDYSARGRDMFINYRKIQRISVEMEELNSQSVRPVTAVLVKELSDHYQTILDETENHTVSDHLRHFSRAVADSDPHYSRDNKLFRKRRRAMLADFAITSFPYLTLVVPVVLLLPLAASLSG